jgi:hypothetical protein
MNGATTVPLPGGGSGNAVRGEAVFDQLACASYHPEPLFTLDLFRLFNLNGFSTVQSVRMREVGTPVILPLRTRCQDANRPTGADGSLGFGVPTLRGIWDTFPLLVSGSAGLQAVGSEPTFTGSCTNGSSGCCTQLRSPLNPGGTSVPATARPSASRPAISTPCSPTCARSRGRGGSVGGEGIELGLHGLQDFDQPAAHRRKSDDRRQNDRTHDDPVLGHSLRALVPQ